MSRIRTPARGISPRTAVHPKDRENLLFAARKRKQPTRSVARDPAEVDAALVLISSYVAARARAQRAA